MKSIERYLLAWILGALALGAVLVAMVTYVVTFEEMNEVFDADLKNVAEGMVSYHRAVHPPSGHLELELPARTDVPEDTEIVTLTWTRAGQRVYASDPRVQVPYADHEGLARIQVADEQWIVYTTVKDDAVAQAAQRVSQRRQMAGESAAKVLPPMLVLLVAVCGLLVFGLRRGLRPLDAAARDIAARSAQALDPIATRNIPREIQPLVLSINDLIGRLALAFSAQRRFLADAAHELRTPITALRLQAQILSRSGDDASRHEAMAELEAGVQRAQRLVQQLLQVSRMEPDGEPNRREPIDLATVVRGVVGQLSPKADELEIDLGAQCGEGATILGDPDQLTTLLNNLVENALRYTQPGGTVDVRCWATEGQSFLSVVDNGPGIAEADMARVFERFYRGSNASMEARTPDGSGLGLAIVRAIAERHGAAVQLLVGENGQGLEARVGFARA